MPLSEAQIKAKYNCKDLTFKKCQDGKQPKAERPRASLPPPQVPPRRPAPRPAGVKPKVGRELVEPTVVQPMPGGIVAGLGVGTNQLIDPNTVIGGGFPGQDDQYRPPPLVFPKHFTLVQRLKLLNQYQRQNPHVLDNPAYRESLLKMAERVRKRPMRR